MIDIDFSTKPRGFLPGPPATPYIEAGAAFTCAQALEVRGSLFVKDGLGLPSSDLRIELPNAAVVVILELAVGISTGIVQIEASDVSGVVLGPPIVTSPATALHDYNVVDGQ